MLRRFLFFHQQRCRLYHGGLVNVFLEKNTTPEKDEVRLRRTQKRGGDFFSKTCGKSRPGGMQNLTSIGVRQYVFE